MKLLIIRHATAVASGTPGIEDDERPLTPRGIVRFRRAARGLARIVRRPDVLLSSPLPRAWQTAEIAARAFGRIEPEVEATLAAGRDVADLIGALGKQRRRATIAVVGHEPMLSMLLARLVGARAGERFAFKKGGAALVDLPEGPQAPGQLLWFVKPRILRTLGDK